MAGAIGLSMPARRPSIAGNAERRRAAVFCFSCIAGSTSIVNKTELWPMAAVVGLINAGSTSVVNRTEQWRMAAGFVFSIAGSRSTFNKTELWPTSALLLPL